jgi:hypothetical protein
VYLVTGVYHLKSMKVEACQSPCLQRSNILRFSFPINLRTCISEGLGRLLSSNRQTPFSTRGRNPRFLLRRPIRPRSLLEEKQLVGSTDGVVHPQKFEYQDIDSIIFAVSASLGPCDPQCDLES